VQYQIYGINVQAGCDHKCRFVYAALAAPGGANNIAAFKNTKLSQMIQNMPLRRFVVGYNAYVCSETLLTPFSGVDKEDPSKDAFNFYLSQRRIHIEQTFGLMTGKWRILRQPLQMHLKMLGKYLCVLQGYIISESTRAIFLSTILKVVKESLCA